MDGVAREYSDALNREVTYSDIPPEDWEQELKKVGLPEHLTRHLLTMAELDRAGRYDRMADGVERVTGRRARASGNLCHFTRMSWRLSILSLKVGQAEQHASVESSVSTMPLPPSSPCSHAVP